MQEIIDEKDNFMWEQEIIISELQIDLEEVNTQSQ
jgi:hypothetical protein